MEARVLQELAVQRTERVLEVGTGSGYLTALLAHRAAEVFTVEIKPSLAELGRANLARHGRDNVTGEIGDGAQGYAKWAPYDVVVLTGSTPLVPRALLDCLTTGGRLFAVVGDPPAMAARIYTCVAPGVSRSLDLFETVIAPLANCAQPPRFKF
jgi:protein-L-isoaspartate(D-aspartate) O-methyltransferase